MEAQLKARLQALSKKRADHVRSLVTNNDHSHKILAEDLYSESTHFLFELLQNAEDEGATRFHLRLDEHGLVLTHDGRPFDEEDVEAITTVGNNQRKKSKRNAIGRFGIGFKSVFRITRTPRIRSGELAFTLKDYIIPLFDFNEAHAHETIIELPFDREDVDIEDLANDLSDSIDCLDHRHLLFLNSVATIEWETELDGEKRTGGLYKTIVNDDRTGLERVLLRSGEVNEHFLLGSRDVLLPHKDLPVKLAFKLSGTTDADIEPVKGSPLYAFFPTAQETGLSFLLHAPFVTTPARDNLQDDTAGSNDMLLDELAELFVDVVQRLADSGQLSPVCWNAFPCNVGRGRTGVYSRFFQRLRSACMDEGRPWLAGADRTFRAAQGLFIPDPEQLTELLTDQEWDQYFGRAHWLPDEWWDMLSEDVRSFLRDGLKIPVIDLGEFRSALPKEFYASRSKDWLIKLYSIIQEQKDVASWKHTAIIRDAQGAMTAAFDQGGRALVYLPDKGESAYCCVDRELVESATDFMRSLGLRKPEIIDEVIEIVLPRFRANAGLYPEWRNDIVRVRAALASERTLDKERTTLLQVLKGTAFLPATSEGAATATLVKPEECYYPSKHLRLVLDGCDDVWWLDLTSFVELTEAEWFVGFMRDLRVWGQPRKVSTTSTWSQEQIRTVTEGWHSSHIRRSNHDLEGLQSYLATIDSLDKSRSLWNVLLGKDVPYVLRPRELLMGEIEYDRNRYGVRKSLPSSALLLLQQRAWLMGKDGQFRRPSEMTLAELHGGYSQRLAGVSELVELLGFKEDDVAQFESEHPELKVVSVEEYDEFTIWKREQEKLKKDRTVQEPVVPYGRLLDVDSVDGEEFSIEEVVNDTGDGFMDRSADHIEVTPVVYKGSRSSAKGTDYTVAIAPEQVEVGQWGEDYVARSLKVRCERDPELTLIELNNAERAGVGRDFQLHRNGRLVEVIEVKTTTEDLEGTVKLSRRQWEQAVRYHHQGGPVTYWVYCVYRANSADPCLVKIKDPVAALAKGQIIVNDLVFRIPV